LKKQDVHRGRDVTDQGGILGQKADSGIRRKESGGRGAAWTVAESDADRFGRKASCGKERG